MSVTEEQVPPVVEEPAAPVETEPAAPSAEDAELEAGKEFYARRYPHLAEGGEDAEGDSTPEPPEADPAPPEGEAEATTRWRMRQNDKEKLKQQLAEEASRRQQVEAINQQLVQAALTAQHQAPQAPAEPPPPAPSLEEDPGAFIEHTVRNAVAPLSEAQRLQQQENEARRQQEAMWWQHQQAQHAQAEQQRQVFSAVEQDRDEYLRSPSGAGYPERITKWSESWKAAIMETGKPEVEAQKIIADTLTGAFTQAAHLGVNKAEYLDNMYLRPAAGSPQAAPAQPQAPRQAAAPEINHMRRVASSATAGVPGGGDTGIPKIEGAPGQGLAIMAKSGNFDKDVYMGEIKRHMAQGLSAPAATKKVNAELERLRGGVG